VAIGFSLSSVSDIAIDDEERAIYFQLKNVRYKIIIDDIKMGAEVSAAIDRMIDNANKSKTVKARTMPEFYKG
jgi:hypothetical protein